MKSLDLIKNEFKDSFKAALDMKEGGDEAMAEAMAKFAAGVEENIMNSVRDFQNTHDTQVLASRGIKQLTSEETKFWNAYAQAVKTKDIKASFTNIDKSYPQTFIADVLSDIKKAFPILDAVDAIDTTLVTKILVNNEAAQLATWGAIGAAISKELDASITELDLTACKLSAYIPLSMDMVEAGAPWIEAYVRAILVEAIGTALSTAIVTGSGKGQPAGMDRDLSNFDSSTGYSKKDAVAITSLGAAQLGALYASLAVSATGRSRAVNNVIFACKTTDYYSKVFPAIYDVVTGTTRTALPLNFVTCDELSDGEAVIGLAKNYKLGITFGGKTGELTFSDDVKFLDDLRVFKSKILANGRSIDNTSFIRLDISDLVPDVLKVDVNGNVVAAPAEGAIWTTQAAEETEESGGEGGGEGGGAGGEENGNPVG